MFLAYFKSKHGDFDDNSNYLTYLLVITLFTEYYSAIPNPEKKKRYESIFISPQTYKKILKMKQNKHIEGTSQSYNYISELFQHSKFLTNIMKISVIKQNVNTRTLFINPCQSYVIKLTVTNCF